MVKIDPFVIEETRDEDGKRHSLSRQKSGDFVLWMAHLPVFNEMVHTVRAESHATGFKSKPVASISKLSADKNREKDRSRLKEIEAATTPEEIAMAKAMAHMNTPWRQTGSDFTGPAVRALEEMITESLYEGRVEEYDLFIECWQSLKALLMIMDTLRITLYPTGGAGSQSGDLKSYQARNKAIASQIKRAKERFR